MNTQTCFRRAIKASISVVALGVCSGTYAQSNWNVLTGNWSDPNNWDPAGLPIGVKANVNNGGIATINTDLTGTSPSGVGVGNGGAVGSPVTGTLNVETGGIIQPATEFRVGDGEAATGTLNLNGGTVDIFTGAGDAVVIGGGSGGNGTVNQTAGVFTNEFGSNTRIGGWGGTGSYTLSGDSSVIAKFSILSVGFAGGTGTVVQNGGYVEIGSFAGGDDFAGVIGHDGGTGSYTITAGEFKADTGRLQIKRGGDTGNGLLDVQGGTVTVSGRIDIADGNGTGELRVSGGSVTSTAEIFVGSFTTGSIGIFTQTGGQVNAPQVRAAFNPGTTGTINLNGGTLTTGRVWMDTVNHGTGTFNANGGTLKPTGGDGNFMLGFTQVNLSGNGLAIDSSGVDLGTSVPFAGDGDLTIRGTGGGKLYLNASQNTYTGNTIVESGAFELLAGGLLTFLVGDDGVNNYIAGDSGGDGTAYIGGSIAFNLTGASTTPGSLWDIVHIETLAGVTFDAATFSVQGFTKEAETTLWKNGIYTFDQATGDLFVAVPEPGTCALLIGSLGVLAIARRRRIQP